MAPTTTRISPTAYYTGTTWLRHDLGDKALEQALQTWRYDLVQPLMRLGRAMHNGAGLDEVLLQRHRIIDHLLDREIQDHGLRQIVEVPCGLSARGLRTCQAHPDVIYIEADLPHMVEMKQSALAGRLSPGHSIVPVDLLVPDGPGSLGALIGGLDPAQPVALIMEGMLNYFDEQTIRDIWTRGARAMSSFPRSTYTADVAMKPHINASGLARMFMKTLSVVARGHMHVHFTGRPAATDALLAAGFGTATVHEPSDHHDLGLPAANAPDHIAVLEAHGGPDTTT